MGTKTVVNARQDDTDRDAIANLGMIYVRVPMSAWDADDEEVIRFLRIATDPKAIPVFVHCHRGAIEPGFFAPCIGSPCRDGVRTMPSRK
jgi:protein tyrosine phosphatase (PTP) superfamily phosphohydrolase (DUF442 family)